MFAPSAPVETGTRSAYVRLKEDNLLRLQYHLRRLAPFANPPFPRVQ